jgi:hypothetical protein
VLPTSRELPEGPILKGTRRLKHIRLTWHTQQWVESNDEMQKIRKGPPHPPAKANWPGSKENQNSPSRFPS